MTNQARINQIEMSALKAGVSVQNTRRDMTSFKVERAFGWSVSKLYNVACFVASLFESHTTNDLSVLKFELAMLDSFMATLEFDALAAEVKRAEADQTSTLLLAHAAGGVNANSELFAECVAANTRVEQVVSRVHALYNERVTLKNIF